MINFTINHAHSLITYFPDSGRVWYNERERLWFKTERAWKSWNVRFAGKEIIASRQNEYLRISTPLYRMHLHRFIWFYMTGEWPDCIDHINGIRSDNRWENLRNVTNQENSKNSKRSKNNTSGAMGVFLNKETGKWRVIIRDTFGKRVHVGYFLLYEDAVDARKAAEVKYGYHENHDRH